MTRPPELQLQHDDHIWITWRGQTWAIERIEGKTLHLWRGHHPNLERTQIDTTNVDWETYATTAREWLSSSEPQFTQTGQAVQPKDLADKIAHYPKVRLCANLDGAPHPRDWLIHERDRYLIVQALRALQKAWDLKMEGG